MKRIYLGVSVCMVCNMAIAQGTQMIYGLNNAERFTQQKQTKLLFVQANSFVNQTYAQHFQRELQSKTTYPVKIEHKIRNNKSFYAVIVGPISSAEELRKTASELKATTTQPHQLIQTHHPKLKPMAPPIIKPTSKIAPTSHLTAAPQHAVTEPSKPFSRPLMSLARSWLADGNWFVGVGAGGLYNNLPSSTTVHNGSAFTPPHDVDLYTTSNSSGSVVTEVSAGHRWTTSHNWFPAYSLGVLWQYGFNNNMGNTITQYSEPEFLNYTYNWNVQTNLLLAAAKLNVFQYKRISPFINGGIGASFNLASGYTETALPNVTPRVSPGFASNTASQFAYQLGAGLDLQLTSKVLASVGYNYQNIGHVASGNGVSTWSGETLSLGSSAQNEFLISLHYLFDNNNNNMKQ